MTSLKRSGSPATRARQQLAVEPLSPRKQPLQPRSMAMVEAILEASARILATSGAGALTTNAAAERAGVSIGSLYQYFPSRDAILVALIKRFEVSMQARMQAALAHSQGSFDEQLSALVRTSLTCHFEAPLLAETLEAEERRLGSSAAPLLADAENQMSAFLRTFVASHAVQDCKEMDRVVHRMEVVGRALVDDALRRFDTAPQVPEEIVAAIRGCAPRYFWKESVS